MTRVVDAPAAAPAADAWRTLSDLVRKYHVDRSTIYRWVRAGKFPAPIELAPAVPRWPPERTDAWEKERAQQR